MIYNSPLIPFAEEFYKMMSCSDELSFKIFDSGLPPEEILKKISDMDNIKIGIITDISINQEHSKVDNVIWKVTASIECLSTYRGRLKTAEMMQEIANTVTRLEKEFDANLQDNGYAVLHVMVGDQTIGNAVQDSGLTWQSGHITITYLLNQLIYN